MPLKGLFKKKEKIQEEEKIAEPQTQATGSPPLPQASEFVFLRTTTNAQFEIDPPGGPGEASPIEKLQSPTTPKKQDRPTNRLRSKSHAHPTATTTTLSSPPKPERRLSERFHLSAHRTRSHSSVNLPQDLPEIKDVARTPEEEAQWEKRATMLAGSTIGGRPVTPGSPSRPGRISRANSGQSIGKIEEVAEGDIQEAIRLHEAGNYERATELFGKLADPDGANNAISQVLYGLSLRHGWGCEPDQEKGIEYLQLALSNSAAIESAALAAGMKKGGDHKGELVLAIFELANSFRNGWGVKKDPVAAVKYYETAANLGDTDAMNEAAWCYLEGFGCKKDKFKAATYLRKAEEKGNIQVGNNWIWKDKYGGPKKS